MWTDELITKLGIRTELPRGHGTGLVVFADEKPTAHRRFVTKCPMCGKPINPLWRPEIGRFWFDCTKPTCTYTKGLGHWGYIRLLAQMTDTDGRPIPGKSVTLPV